LWISDLPRACPQEQLRRTPLRHPARIQERLTFDTPEVRRAWIEVLLVFVEIHFGGCHSERTRPDECRRFGRVYAGIAERLGIDGNSPSLASMTVILPRNEFLSLEPRS
jgi:hypothetical protein